MTSVSDGHVRGLESEHTKVMFKDNIGELLLPLRIITARFITQHPNIILYLLLFSCLNVHLVSLLEGMDKSGTLGFFRFVPEAILCTNQGYF